MQVKKGTKLKKEVLISIKGVQTVEDSQDVTELFTQGLFYKKNDNYYVCYDESETTGFGGCKTTLKIEKNNRLTLIRAGEIRSHLIIELGQRNVGHYGVPGGDVMVGVYTKDYLNNLNDDGGDLYFKYSMDINSSLISDNEVFINVHQLNEEKEGKVKNELN
ncbi:MAG: DUF1934 domain-containing protein [Oscillospiraceae bacterium]